MVEIYTDGACSGNPGAGGWAAMLKYGKHVKEISGAEQQTTNNRMELTAVIKALEELKKKIPVKIYTDSQYVKQGMESWIKTWKINGWKDSKKNTVKNIDLWQRLDELCTGHKVKFSWVKAHSGHLENERVDNLARTAIKQLR